MLELQWGRRWVVVEVEVIVVVLGGGGDGSDGQRDDDNCAGGGGDDRYSDNHDKMVGVEMVISYLENKNNISIKISGGNKDLSWPKNSPL
ncbi:hypothetical protein L3X38_036523 [Prunus dulcis]|uniref:Uncharacterized protein n=1 Tax=Prunus dulcis TaxID=3755 RepID=A0AAD4V3H3_PRUDU|nr:hypothetical protein L3X38_036523 [Prunus dulcis]